MAISSLLWIGGIATVAVVSYAALKSKRIQPPPPPPVTPPVFKPRLAKMAFIDHIEEFTPLLNTLTNNTFSLQLWTEHIVNVNDPHLTAMWKTYASNKDLQVKWKQLLASWQIKNDTCTSFTCATADNQEAYQLPDGSMLTMGVKYKVETPCWVMTTEDDNGQVRKTVISKGIVTPFET